MHPMLLPDKDEKNNEQENYHHCIPDVPSPTRSLSARPRLNGGAGAEYSEHSSNTYWRNEKTGDWFIGITANHVIYGNMVWDIVVRTEKKDAYTPTISNGETIKVGKQKKGLRKGFTDNGYRDGDSVTIIGWLKEMPQILAS